MADNILARLIFVVAGMFNLAFAAGFFLDRELHQKRVFGHPSNYVLLMHFFPDETAWLPLLCNTLDVFVWAAVGYSGVLYALHGLTNLNYLTKREVTEFLMMKFVASASIILILRAKAYFCDYYVRGEWSNFVATVDTVMGFLFLYGGSLLDKKQKKN